MRYLLDTNVISELIARQPNSRVVEWIDDLDPGATYLSVITIGEIRKGIERVPDSPRKAVLWNWLQDDLLLRFGDHILPLDVPTVLTWGELIGQMERIGRRLPAIDSLIAATALHHHAHLVTRNEDDLHETGIAVVNPWRQ